MGSDNQIVREQLTKLQPMLDADAMLLHRHAVAGALDLTNGSRGNLERLSDQVAVLTAVIVKDRTDEQRRHLAMCPMAAFTQPSDDGVKRELDVARLSAALPKAQSGTFARIPLKSGREIVLGGVAATVFSLSAVAALLVGGLIWIRHSTASEVQEAVKVATQSAAARAFYEPQPAKPE